MKKKFSVGSLDPKPLNAVNEYVGWLQEIYSY